MIRRPPRSTQSRSSAASDVYKRQEAKMVGGLGPCGRDLCCSLFLSDFNPVSIKMAKEQDLPLNPSKISGICGRLMCCLKYEVEAYEEFNLKAPALGSRVELEEGEGTVVGYQVPLGVVVVEVETCLLYTSDAADDLLCVDLGGRRIIKKKKKTNRKNIL